MGCRILEGERINEGDGSLGACFYSSVTNTVFGPLFEDAGEAEDFLRWLEEHPTHAADPRYHTEEDLLKAVEEFRS